MRCARSPAGRIEGYDDVLRRLLELPHDSLVDRAVGAVTGLPGEEHQPSRAGHRRRACNPGLGKRARIEHLDGVLTCLSTRLPWR